MAPGARAQNVLPGAQQARVPSQPLQVTGLPAGPVLDGVQQSAPPRAGPRGRACTSRRTPGRRSACRLCTSPTGQVRSSRTIMVPVPRRLPAFCTESKSIATVQVLLHQKVGGSAAGQQAAEPEAVPHAAGVLLEDFAHGACPWAAPTGPGVLDLAADAVDLGAAVFAVAQAPKPVGARCSTMCGTLQRVSTLLTIVGLPHRPTTGGKGGLARGLARRPSSALSSAVSSPQM